MVTNMLLAKPVGISELLLVGHGLTPLPSTPPAGPMDQEKKDKVREIYSEIYALGLDKVLETRWFSTRGVIHVLNDAKLCENYLTLYRRFHITAEIDWEGNCRTQSLEAQVIWETFCLCRQVSASLATTDDPNAVIEANEGVHDAAKRLLILETLITNQHLDAAAIGKDTDGDKEDKVTSPGQKPLENQLKTREREFWQLLGKYCTIREDPAAYKTLVTDADGKAVLNRTEADLVLLGCRNLLDSRENRDVIYSVAIARHLGQRAHYGAYKEPFPAAALTADDPDDPKHKLNVARNFLASESEGKATTQAMMRVCGIAMRSWGPAMRQEHPR